jgi:membrane fusion protein (multidrug efflux system)
MRGKWFLLAAAAVLIAIAAGALSRWRNGASPQAALPQTPVSPAPAPAPGGSFLTLSGPIHAQKTVPVNAELEGKIEAFSVEIGQDVFEGQMLARIGNPGLESAQQLAAEAVETIQSRVNTIESSILSGRLESSRARADASRAKAEYERTQKVADRQQLLHREGATPRLAFERAQAEFARAQAEFASLDELARQAEGRITRLLADLDRARKLLTEKSEELEEAKTEMGASEVLAPVDGLLVARRKQVGDMVALDEPAILDIAIDLALLEVTLEPKPEELARIKAGQEAVVSVAELAIDGMPGEVAEIRGNQVIVSFASPDPSVKPAMTAGVRIKIE